MGAIREVLFGLQEHEPDNDAEPGQPSLDRLAETITEKKNYVVHCEAELHRANMQLKDAQQKLRAELNERHLLTERHHGDD